MQSVGVFSYCQAGDQAVGYMCGRKSIDKHYCILKIDTQPPSNSIFTLNRLSLQFVWSPLVTGFDGALEKDRKRNIRE
jgi:hypothetical protein